MTAWEVEQAAKLARLHRIAAACNRTCGNQKVARQHEQLARKEETKLRDYATELELA